MSKILIIEDEPKLMAIFTMNLNMYVGAYCTEHTDPNIAFESLKTKNEYNLLVCKDRIDGKYIAKELSEKIKELSLNIPLLIMGEDHGIENVESINNIAIAESLTDIRDFLRKAAKFLNVTAMDMIELVVPDLIPVPAHYFLLTEISICDVFYQNSKTNQYQKALSAQSKYKKDIIKDHIARGRKQLFVLAANRLRFTDGFTVQVVHKLKTELSLGDRIEKTAQTTEIFKDQFNQVGFNNNTIKLAKACISSLNKAVDTTEDLKHLLKNLTSNPSCFAYKHSQTVLYISHQAVDNMEWGSSEQKEKLAFVSFFHDISLNTDDEVKIDTNEKLEEFHDDKVIYDKINTHANNAADIVLKAPDMPLGVDTIIKQHHGMRNGIGFNKSPANDLSPLAILFIVSENFAHEILKNEGNDKFNPTSYLKSARKQYRKSQYQKVCDALLKVKW
jgi:hypothetical protein